jgi:modulator of FtsH protease
MTLLFSAAIAAASAALQWPAPGLLLTLGGYFGLLFAVYRFKNSGWALPAVFALTGFMGYSLGPVLAKTLALPGGAQVVTLALAATGATFLALSAWVLTTRRDFSFMGGFLFAGMVIALVAGLGAVFLQMPALGLAVAIPAVLGYNALVRGNKFVVARLNRFGHDLHAYFLTGARVQADRPATR